MHDDIERRIDQLAGVLERMRLDEYVAHVSNRGKLIWENILYGLARGFGFTIGFSILGAALIVILHHLAAKSMPSIGEFMREVLREADNAR